jgi:hypothetical protein
MRIAALGGALSSAIAWMLVKGLSEASDFDHVQVVVDRFTVLEPRDASVNSGHGERHLWRVRHVPSGGTPSDGVLPGDDNLLPAAQKLNLAQITVCGVVKVDDGLAARWLFRGESEQHCRSTKLCFPGPYLPLHCCHQTSDDDFANF